MKLLNYIVVGLIAFAFWTYLSGCQGQRGKDGKRGEEGEIIFPPGSGTTLVVSCDWQWQGNFNYLTRYSVWKRSNGLTRVAGVCTKKGKCEYSDYTTKEYPTDSAGYSRAEVSDGLVTAWLEGSQQAIFENLHGVEAYANCEQPTDGR